MWHNLNMFITVVGSMWHNLKYVYSDCRVYMAYLNMFIVVVGSISDIKYIYLDM